MGNLTPLQQYRQYLLVQIINGVANAQRYRFIPIVLVDDVVGIGDEAGKGEVVASFVLYNDGERTAFVTNFWPGDDESIPALKKVLQETDIEWLVSVAPQPSIPSDITQDARRLGADDLTVAVWTAKHYLEDPDLPTMFLTRVKGVNDASFKFWYELWVPINTPIEPLWEYMLKEATS